VLTKEGKNTIEVRGFLHLDRAFRKKFDKVPLILDIEEPITGYQLADILEVKPEEVEVIFVNGNTQSLDYTICPGDRVAFLPPGCPGPYRVALGFYGKNQNNPRNFKRKDNS
jgi:hypothetical protein